MRGFVISDVKILDMVSNEYPGNMPADLSRETTIGL